jgi:hypothetical protein
MLKKLLSKKILAYEKTKWLNSDEIYRELYYRILDLLKYI